MNNITIDDLQSDKCKMLDCRTIAGADQYDYPYTGNLPYSFESGCIGLLFINGESYKKVPYEYLKTIKNESIAGKEDMRIFADFNKKIFIFPTPKNTDDIITIIAVATPKKQSNKLTK